MNKLLLALWVLCLTACSYLPFSGGALEGNPSGPLDDWRTIGDADIVQLETRPSEPYSVNLWMVAEETQLFLYAGDNHAEWVRHIESNNAVRLKVADTIYELQGARVSDETEFQRFASAWKDKYGSDLTDSTAADTYLIRLTPRQS